MVNVGFAAVPGADVDPIANPRRTPPVKIAAPVAAVIPTNFRRVIMMPNILFYLRLSTL